MLAAPRPPDGSASIQTEGPCAPLSCDFRYTMLLHVGAMHRAGAGESDGWLVWRSPDPNVEGNASPSVPLKFKVSWCGSNGGSLCQDCVIAEGMLMPDGSIQKFGVWPQMAANCPVPPNNHPMTDVVNAVAGANNASSLCNNIKLTTQMCFVDTDWVIDIFPKVVAANSATPRYFKAIAFQATPLVDANHIQGVPSCPTTDGYTFFYTPNNQPWEGRSRSDFEPPDPNQAGVIDAYFSDYCYEVHFRKP